MSEKEIPQLPVKEVEEPAFVDVPQYSISLAATVVTVLRRVAKEGESPLLFVISTKGPRPTQLPVLGFGQLLELKEALGHVIDSVVVGSVHQFKAPTADKVKSEPPKSESPETPETPSNTIPNSADIEPVDA